VCWRVWCGYGGVRLCCVWDSLGWVWGSEFLLCVGQIVLGLWECVCAVFCTDWSVSADIECVLCVGRCSTCLGDYFFVCVRGWGGLGGVILCCVWDGLVWVWGSEVVLCMGQFGVGFGD